MVLKRDTLSDLLKTLQDDPRLAGGGWLPLEYGPTGYRSEVDAVIGDHPRLHDKCNLVAFVLEEARGNVVRHANDPSGGCCFTRRGEGEIAAEFLFADDGPGFLIRGHRPAYPVCLIGATHEFRRTIDGKLMAHVTDANTVELSFVEAPRAIEHISVDELPTGGMGLAIMAKIMSRVRYLFGIGGANVLWLQLLDEPEGDPRDP